MRQVDFQAVATAYFQRLIIKPLNRRERLPKEEAEAEGDKGIDNRN